MSIKQDHIGDANKMVSSIEFLVKEINQIIDFIPMNKWDEIRVVVQQAKAMREEELNVAYGNGYEQGEMDFYKKMQVKGDKYAEGYSEGYKRALELVKWKIDNLIQGGNK